MDRITVYWDTPRRAAGWPVTVPPTRLSIPPARAAALDRLAADRGMTPVDLLLELVDQGLTQLADVPCSWESLGCERSGGA